MDDQRKNKPRRGTMVVEAALILPLLLILTFGGIKYGWLFIKWQQINNVARHSVRQAIRPGDTTTQTNTLIATLMTNVGMGSIGYGGVDGAPMVTGAASAVGSPVVVEIQVNVADVDILKIPLVPAPATLTARMTMSKEGPGS